MSIVRAFALLLVLFCFTAAQEPYVDSTTLQRIAKKYKQFALNRFKLQQKKLDKLKNATEMQKLEAVNSFYNNVRYMSDMRVYHKRDYWATPYEFLGHDMGDCEDYVIAKYFALKYLGVSTKKMFFTYVRALRLNAPHMVLTYYETPRSEPLVLDNINFKIFPASKRKDLIPIYNFNGESLTKFSSGKQKKKQTQKAKTKWDQLIRDIKRKKI